MSDSLEKEVHLASTRSDACAAVRDVYARLQIEIDRRKPICVASGKCCHFDAYGHRLYVTTLELAAFMNDLLACGRSLPVVADIGGCRFQVGKLCGVHAFRPFGCRIFFCDPTAGDWQQRQYEAFHAELKRLHAAFDVPYFYVEWRAALELLQTNGKSLTEDL